MDPIDAAVERAKSELLGNPLSDVHSVYRGLKQVNGETVRDASGRPIECVVCVVGGKAGSRAEALGCVNVPRAYVASGVEVLTDVVESPPPSIARLDLAFAAQATTDVQRCHECPLPGGVQIAPAGADWVGTLGGAIAFDGGMRSDGKPWGTLFGALTNYHVGVGGRFKAGTKMLQPGPGSQFFGYLHTWKPIDFRGGVNLIDAALLNCRRTDGPYAPATDTVRPVQFGIGAINPEPHTAPQLGDRCIKVGRTTGVTRGTLVGMNNATTVDYGPEGAARFDKQYVIRSDRGNFSDAGDSGSLILHESTLRPMALLYAGSGRDTLANPIAFVLDWAEAQFFRE